MKNKFILFGCGGHARSIADVVLHNHPNASIVFVDENAKTNEKIMGFPVVCALPEKTEEIVPALGDSKKLLLLSQKYTLTSVISKTAHIGIGVKIDEGCFVATNAYIGPETKIAAGCIINTNAVVEHECQIGSFCHIAPNTTICGRVMIGNNVFVGAGTTIKDKISICGDVIIGAGSTIIKDINQPGTYVGSPARRIK